MSEPLSAELSGDHRDSDFVQLEINRTEQSSAWLTSYADITTLLLCFFILFFNLDSVSDFQVIADSFQGEVSESKVSTGSGDIPAIDQQSVIDALKSLNNVVINKEQQQLHIDFENNHFFASGSYHLNKAGKQHVKDVLSALSTVADKVALTIRGHTDDRHVRQDRRRFKSNIELSALRAVTVFKMFREAGYSSQQLSIQGVEPEAMNASTDNNLQHRRVSFVVRMRS